MPELAPDWNSLVDNLPDLVVRLDREFRHLYVNRQWLAEVGIPRDVVLGKTPWEVGIPNALCDLLEDGFQRVLSEKAVHEVLCRFDGPLGEQHYAVRMMPELGPDGEVVAVLAVIRNITAQRRAETALAESEDRFQAFMNYSPGIAWMKDEAGRYVYFSPRFERLFGLTEKDWRGKTDADLWVPEIARMYRDNDLAVLGGGQTLEVIEEARNLDGTDGYWLVFKFLVRDSQGRKFVGGTGVDITERRLSELNLQESEIWLRAILDAGEFVVVGMTEDYRLFEWNRAAEIIYGRTRAEVLGEDYLVNFLPEEARAGVAEEIRQILLGRPTVAYPNEVLHRDGSRRTILWNACRVLDGRQQVRGLLAIGQDISELQRAQTLIRESEARYRQLVESIQDVVWSVEIDGDPFHGRMTFVSPQCKEMLGFTSEDFLSRPEIWAEHLHAEDWPAMQAAMQQLVSNSEPVSRVYRFRHGLTGAYRWLEDRVAARKDASGHLTGLFGVARDISDRVRAEDALRRSEQFTQAVLDSVPVEIAVIDRWGRIVAVNAPWSRIGETQTDAYATHLELGGDYFSVCRSTAFGGSDSAAEALRGIVRVIDGRQERFELEYPRPAQDGPRWFLMQVVRPSAELGGAIITHFDITARRRAEDSLRENEQRLRLALDASHAGTWSWDVAGNIATWDRRYGEHYEIDPQALASHELWMSHVHPEDRGRLQARILAMLEPGGGDLWNEEFRTIPLKDGVRWMNGLGRVERDRKGRALRFSGLNLDITDRKRSELAALQSAAETQALMDAFPDLHFWMDADGTIRRFSGGGRTLVPPEEFLNRRMQSFLPEDVGRRLMIGVTAAISQETIQEAEYSLHEPDGVHWYDARLVPLPASQGVLAVIRDVTARRQAEEESRRLQAQLQHTQKLESLGVLAGGIAHDFNNILTSIMGFTDLAMTMQPEGSACRLHLDRVLTSARRAAELTQQMLAYSGKGQFAVQDVNLSELVRDLGPLLQMSVSKKAQVRYSLPADLPAVRADAAQLRQIIMNLIINASDSLEDRSGEISVTTRAMNCGREELSGSYLEEQLPPGKYVILEVADTGVGMDEATRARIFDPFFTTKSAGRGLGLAAVLGIIRGHHGAIRVHSQPGQGSTFQVMFPEATDPLPAVVLPAVDVVPQSLRGTVLVVDDEAGVRDLVQAMLEKAGFTVLTACDGSVAVELYQSAAADISLVLLDMTMPVLGGEETLAELRRINSAVRVVLTSGYNEQSTFAEGAAGFLQKPFRFQELIEAVERAMST